MEPKLFWLQSRFDLDDEGLCQLVYSVPALLGSFNIREQPRAKIGVLW